MSIPSFFISRPIGTTLLAVGLALSGILAFKVLPVSPLPQIEFPTISIQAALPGASPEVMASSVATPLERQLSRIAGITEMTSSSSLGNTRVVVQFELSRNIDGAARDVQAAIEASLSQLPTSLPSLPTYRKVNPADAPVMVIALTSQTYDSGKMYDIGSTILEQKLSQIDGIGQVFVGGSSLPAVRVELNLPALNKYGISTETVRTVLSTANVTMPKGQLTNGAQTSDIVANDQIFHISDYKPLIVRANKENVVRVSDVADVIDSVEDLHNAGLADNKPAIVLVLFKQPGVNVIETVDRVRAAMPQLKASIPAAIDMTVIMDRTTTIRASLHDVELTLLIAMILVILVVYWFFRDARASFIPSVVVPLSLLGTFGVMYLCNYTLDNLSLMALTIATGFVVDDAVVVLENIQRHVESGMKAFPAALLGAREVSFTVLSMSTSLVAVFIPILLMGGIVGRLSREFAMVLSIAVLVSLVVSLTVTPMMCAHILKAKKTKQTKRYFIERVRDDYYSVSLRWILDHPRLTLFVTLATIVLNVFLFILIPKGFFPIQDTGRLTAIIQAQQDTSFHSMKEKLIDFSKVVTQDPAVQSVAGFVGGSGSASIPNTGSMFITLKPLEERKVSADLVIDRLRKKLSSVAGATLYLQSAQDVVIGGRSSNAQFQYTFTALHLEDLNTWVPRVTEELSKISGIADVNSDQLNRGLRSYLTIDRDTASRFGITAQQIDDVLYDAFGQRQVSNMYTLMNQYHVVMVVAPRFWQHPERLNETYVPSSTGALVPLSTISQFAPSATLLSVNHQGQFPAATLSFNLLPGTALGDAVINIGDALDKMHLPISKLQGSFQGTAQAFQASLASQPYLIMATLFVLYIVLGMLYESTIHPITILSTLPSAGVGALLSLLITKTELSIITLIGIILLIGIVKKNAIMMIDFALHTQRTEQKSPYEAIHEACMLRFRPIMMTTFAAMLGSLPLVLNQGIGSELRKPLGISIIGGLILSQLLTLYTTPVIYLTFEKFSQWSRQKWKNLHAERMI
jgi:multidrug efflux pump